ncbi:MAG: ABC transporter permease subunit [Oscillospiraceae bacterium]
MGAVFRRELLSYFTSPIGYIVLAAFYASSGFLFTVTALQAGSASLTSMFGTLIIVLLILIPILTMRTLSEEKKQKTDQCLLTSPVSLPGLVFGKFLAAFLVLIMAVAITLVYAVVVSAFAKPDWLVVFGNITGLLLLGAAFIAVGIFVSSLTENQMVSVVISFVIMVGLFLIGMISSVVTVDFISKILDTLSFTKRYNDFTYGIFDLSNVLFFVSVAVAFLYLTVRVLEKRRWG